MYNSIRLINYYSIYLTLLFYIFFLIGAVQEIKSTILSPPNTTVPSQNKDEPPNVPGLKNLTMCPSLDGSLKFELNNSNFTIEVVCADISKEKTDLIMHVTNQDFGFSYELSNSIIRAGGESVVRECKGLREPAIFSTQYTRAGNLFVGQIAHVIAPEKPSYSDLQHCLANFLDDILKKNVAKVSFSTSGTVSMWYSATEFAKMIFDNLHCIIAQSKKPSLRLARIVILDEQEFIEFKNAAIKAYVAYRYSASPSSQTAESPHSPNLFGSKNIAQTTAKQGNILIKIYSDNWENIDEAYKALTSMLNGNIGMKAVTNAIIKKLADSDLQKLYKLAFDFDFEIRVYQRNESLIFGGHYSDFLNVDEKISEILKDVTDRG